MADVGERSYFLFTFVIGNQCISKPTTVLFLWQTFLGYYPKDFEGMSDKKYLRNFGFLINNQSVLNDAFDCYMKFYITMKYVT